MSFYLPLGKIPENPEERDQLISAYLEYEAYLDSLRLSNIHRRVIKFLLNERGYSPAEIEINRVFSIQLEDLKFDTIVDLILKLNNKRLILIICATSSLDSWERYAIALCRVVESFTIPYALITDGELARFINISDGSVTTGFLDLIPSKNECEKILSDMIFTLYPEEKKDREGRIVYAFEGLRYPSGINF
ncbi:MAG: type I restriction enzyme HsdR N-terminal domain-containing protein [Thermodesulfovibrionales bacterium]|nr:type I restriction enzyme HsdR N-terminal domain-containing protein [Thermodesulfovibrionales bacterium]